MMNPLPFLARMGGLTSPMGLGITGLLNAPTIYDHVKDDSYSAASRKARGVGYRDTLRGSFNDDRKRLGLPPLQFGEPTAVNAVQPAQTPKVTSYDDTGVFPQVPQSLRPLDTVSVKPAPTVGDAYAQPAMQAQAQAPQPNATGPDLIQKFLTMLHSAGPATPDYDRHALNGW